MALTLDARRARPASPPGAPLLTEAAAWIGAVDRDGAAVSVIHTLGGAFGSGVVSSRTGILMGNRGAALALDPDLGPMLRPGRRVPLASLPAMFSDARGGLVAAFGACGEPAAETVVQLADRLMRGQSTADALAAARFALGATPDGEAAVLVASDGEPGPWGPLRAAGHQVLDAGELGGEAGVALRDGAGRVTALADVGTASGL